MIIDVEDILEHHGIKGMKWGVRRDPKTGVRPLAKTLDESRFGRAANANAQRSMDRSNKRVQNKSERVQRLKSGKGSLMDKLIRDLDIGGTNTTINGPASTQKRVTMGVAGVALLAIGAAQVARVLKETGHLHM